MNILYIFSKLGLINTLELLLFVGVLSRSYHPAGGTGAFSGHMMARSSILTGTPLHALGAMFARRTRLLAAAGTTQRWHDGRHFIDESEREETTFRRRRDSNCTSHFKPIIIHLTCFCYVGQLLPNVIFIISSLYYEKMLQHS